MQDHQGNPSTNLGDLIIYESISKYLEELFPDKEVIRISTHTFLEKRHFDILKENNLKFFGGTNALSSNIRQYHQWKLSRDRFFFLNPGIREVILFGVGWWQYQEKPTWATKLFYKNVLSGVHQHSVRDQYTKEKVLGMNIRNVLNTTCPTTWTLDGRTVNRKMSNVKDCLFMLTDYSSNAERDNELLKIILEYYSGTLYFFPQGALDIDYMNSLELFKANKGRIKILERTIEAFNDCISRKDINFIGTRLHGGIKCLQNSIDSIIIAIDNRAMEISRDIHLPVVDRNDYSKLRQWLNGEKVFANINLPMGAINEWKEQFRK